MFDILARQAESIARQREKQSLGKGRNFTLSQAEFDDFCKHYLFDQLKGIPLGISFCKKFNEINYVLETLPDASAKKHIETFYIK